MRKLADRAALITVASEPGDPAPWTTRMRLRSLSLAGDRPPTGARVLDAKKEVGNSIGRAFRLARRRCYTALGLALLTLGTFAPASHAARGFVLSDHSDPPAGAILETSPSVVRVWFEAPIVPALSSIWVENAERERVDQGDGHVDARDRKLLEVTVPRLRTGKYRVFWSVVGPTGRRSSGDFPFQVR